MCASCQDNLFSLLNILNGQLFCYIIWNRQRPPEPQRAESTAHGLSTAGLILAWGRYGLTPTILSIKSKSTWRKEARSARTPPATFATRAPSALAACLGFRV